MHSPPPSRTALAAVLLLGFGSASGWCADNRKGIMDSGCCETSFTLRVPYRQTSKGIPAKELLLELRRGCPGISFGAPWVTSDWLKVNAKLCAPESSQCEAATSAKIHLDFVSTNGKHASGSFSVDFPNAGHEEGKFTVKQHHKGPRYICE